MCAYCVTARTETIQQSILVSNFQSISIKIAGDLHVTQAASATLVIEAEPRVVSQLRPRVLGGVLYLETTGEPIITQEPIRFYVTVPSLTAIEASGASTIAVDGLTASSFELDLRGAHDFTATHVRTGTLDIRLRGSGKAALEGSTRKQTIAISGSADYVCPRLASEETSVTIAGSGDALVGVTRHLHASLSGSGDVQYLGNPIIESKLSGSGKVKPRSGS